MKAVIGGLFGAALIFCVTLPMWGENYLISLFLFVFMYITLASSWNLISGFTGYVSFGHVAFWGVGSYTAAIVITRLAPAAVIKLAASFAPKETLGRSFRSCLARPK